MGGFLGGGSKKTEQKTELPSWLTRGSKQAVAMAQDIADTPYQAYTGDRVAGPTGNEQAGYLAANNFAGAYQPYLAQAAAHLGHTDNSLANTDLSGYINPYIDAALKPAADRLSQTYDAQRRAAHDAEVAHGAFGGLRGVLGDQQADQHYLDAVGDLYAKGAAGAYDRAQNLALTDRNHQSQLANAYAQLAQTGAGLTNQQINAQLGAGGAQRAIDQAGKDFDYQQYVENRDWDKGQLAALQSAVSSVPHGQTTTATQSQKLGLGNLISQGLGAAASIYGGGLLGSSLGQALGGALGGGSGGGIGAGSMSQLGRGFNDGLSFGP